MTRWFNVSNRSLVLKIELRTCSYQVHTVHTYVRVYVRTHIYVRTYLRIHTCNVRTYIYIRIRTYIYIRIYIYVYIYIYICIYIRTYMYACVKLYTELVHDLRRLRVLFDHRQLRLYEAQDYRCRTINDFSNSS